jgi:hypothetical protein
MEKKDEIDQLLAVTWKRISWKESLDGSVLCKQSVEKVRNKPLYRSCK